MVFNPSNQLQILAGIILLVALYVSISEIFPFIWPQAQSTDLSTDIPTSLHLSLLGGIEVAALIHFSLRLWPGVPMGVVAISLLNGHGITLSTIGLAISHVIEILFLALGATSHVRWLRFNPAITTPTDIYHFMIRAGIASLLKVLSSIWLAIDMSSITAYHFICTLFSWWGSSFTGLLVFGLGFLACAKPNISRNTGYKDKNYLETVIFAATVFLGMIFIISSERPNINIEIGIVFVLVMMWSALRLGHQTLAIAGMILFTISLTSTNNTLLLDIAGSTLSSSPFIVLLEVEMLLAICMTGALTLAVSMDDLRYSQEEARRSHARFQHFAEGSSDWLWETDKELCFIFISPAVRKHTGLPPEHYLGSKLTDVLAHQGHLPPSDNRASEISENMERLVSALKQQKPFRNLQYELRKDLGKIYHISINGGPIFNDQGVFLGYRGNGVDVTQSVEAQKVHRLADHMLRVSIDTLNKGFAIFDRNDRLVMFNKQFQHAMVDNGIPAPQPGLHFKDWLLPISKKTFWPEAAAANIDPFTWRLERHRNPGEPFEAHLTDGSWKLTTETRTPDGGTVITLADISAIKANEHALREAKEAAERANRAKSEFLAKMSHELRTPLNAVLGFSEIIENEMMGPIQPIIYRDYARHIHEEGQHLLAIIEDLLDLARIESGRLDLTLETIDLQSLLVETLHSQADVASRRGIQLDLPARQDPLLVHGNRRALRQVLLNLLTNAIKFSKAKGQVTTYLAQRGKWAIVRVQDAGIGIDPTEIPRLLDPFEQGASTEWRTRGSAGLGLPITRALLKAQKGRLKLSSRLDYGTVAHVMIPLA